MSKRLLGAGILFAFSLGVPTLVHARELSFGERVTAQRAIEQVYWNHRVWPRENPAAKPPLSAVMTDEAIRAKVESYLDASNALERLWRRPITAEQLQAEMDRMAKHTRDGKALEELFQALNDDPFVIAETLARQTLAERLLRRWYAGDTRFHAAVKNEAEAALARCASSDCMKSTGGEYRETTWTRRVDARVQSVHERGVAVVLEVDEWEDHLQRLAARLGSTADHLPVGRLSGLEETPESFAIVAILAQHDGEITTASVTWPKRSFEAWWDAERDAVGSDLDTSTGKFTLPAVALTACTNDTWTPTPFELPDPRFDHTAVWTGTEMIVWGGTSNDVVLNTGGRYNPATDSWIPTSMTNVPSARSGHTAVWTGTEMIVWGADAALNTGGRYDPSTDGWTATSTGANLAAARGGHTAVWTGTEMIVWGGFNGVYLDSGGRYSPSSDSWTPTSTTNVPAVRRDHVAVWTETEMIVWGGVTAGSVYVNSGGRYNPSTDAWTATSSGANLPTARAAHSAVWTGTEMIVWGGVTAGLVYVNTGGRYNPATDAWTATSTGANVPAIRGDHSAVWTGTHMVVWGGFNFASQYLNTGGRYNPTGNTWATTSITAVTTARARHTAVWTGTELIVWGGSNNASLNVGGRYNPSSNSWIATSTGTNTPRARADHAAVWTGAEMIVWGGFNGGFSGGRYDPSLDNWTTTSTGANLPAGRLNHTAVWTGTEMIVWGGDNGSGTSLNTGARYNPSSNSWLPTSTGANVPAARYLHTAVWSGTEMIVWGGFNGTSYFNTGGRYDPATDAWTATSTGANVPSVRAYHSAVWTGAELIVWGGSMTTGGSYLNTGGRYNPSSDAWTSTSTTNVPAVRRDHSAVWTGTEMIVWGGNFGASNLATGGRYNPSNDSWAVTSTGANVPPGRREHTAVWTGTEMIVWGGINVPPLSTGGRYDPSANSWLATSIGANLPAARSKHTAVWTGMEMIVWGGSPTTSTGGRYCACPDGRIYYRDADGDNHGDAAVSIAACDGVLPSGFADDAADCDDGDASIHPGAAEVCNGLDDDCDQTADDGGSSLCDDGTVCTTDSCNGVAGCGHANNNDPCSDADACTQNDTCQSGACVSGSAVACTASDSCHVVGICEPQTGLCSNPAAPDGTACDDGNGCTTGDACTGGSCQGAAGNPPSEVDDGLRVARNGADAVISWNLAAGASSSAVLRGLVAALPVGPGGGDESCLADNLPSATLTWSDGNNPDPGASFWYLIRGDNACGKGPYGFAETAGVPVAPRVSTTCP